MVQEPIVDEQLVAEHGLTPEEFKRIISILGRVPTYTELGIYSVMWSEHCSYKNSLKIILCLPRHGQNVLAEAGEENAGLVDIGDNLAVAFKIESHNHPSAVEPYQGAATGVGGILRDVFTMGARPIAVLDSLRFGDLSDHRTQYYLSQVVKGIGNYSNCFGVPTVGGETYFDHSYNNNPLVNAMAVGLVEENKVIHAVARGIGNPVMIVGSSTGRDGIHGATFASEEISDRSEDRRPSVQVGDPFTEKCLLEALLEAQEANCLVAVQDMGAAGIACSTSEMSARGGVGMEIDLDLVPSRESGMTPYDTALSESQERMLIVANPDKVETLKRIFTKWNLLATEIGKVIGEDRVIFWKDGRITAEIPARSLVAGYGAPVYVREVRKPSYLEITERFDQESLSIPKDCGEVLVRLLASPNIASKRWVFQQYDHAVQTNVVTGPGPDSALVRIKGTNKTLAITTDGNPRYVYLSPRRGGSIAVAEAARNIVCVGAKPLAITNCLNFGNPYDPETYWQFVEAVAGISQACTVLGTPVTGGNVSFYNEGPDGAVLPTPVIGMIGIVENREPVLTPEFKSEGDLIVLLGDTSGHAGGSEYLRLIHGLTAGQAPSIDLEREKLLHQAVLDAASKGYIKSAHDLSEGGLAVALAECCILNPSRPLGARISLRTNHRLDFLLFGEDQSRILVSIDPQVLPIFRAITTKYALPSLVIGQVGGNSVRINSLADVNLGQAFDAYYDSLERAFSSTGP